MAIDSAKTRVAPAPLSLAPSETYRPCDPSTFDSASTSKISPLEVVIGQDRAVSAVDFGIEIRSDGYNIFALGPPGTGKSATISDVLKREAAKMPVPDDWIYVNNFAHPHQPNAIRLPAGMGSQFQKDMEKLVQDLKVSITQAFEGEEYEKHKREIAQRVGEQQEAKLDALREQAEAAGFTMVRTPAGLAFIPRTPDGETMSREQYQALGSEEQKKIDEGLAQLNEELQQVMRLVRQEQKGGRDNLRNLDEEVTTYAVQHLIDEHCEKWSQQDEVCDYLQQVLKDVVENAEDFKASEEEAPQMFMGMPVARTAGDGAFRKYRVNLLVDNGACKGAPIIRESNPNLQNLVGRVEHLAQFGALVTDFNMVKPGALHAANGGFLVLEARELLTKPYAYDALKRTLKTGQIRIEDISYQLGLVTTATLEPEPIPLDAKIIILGDPYLYYLLYSLDPDFQELFKVKADFDSTTDRTPEAERLYAQFVAGTCRKEELPEFSAEAVARVVEHGSRLVEDQRRLTVRFLDIVDIIRESAHWATHRNGGNRDVIVTAEDVQTAIDQRIYRSNRVEERIREMISEGTIMVDTEGEVTGQINGLSVSMMGDYAFGRPSRITATTRLGEGEVIDIEREVEMGGPIHSKGVLILSGYLGAKYASEDPMSLSIRLVFEQSYSGVEGDSASSAELYAILSSLSGLPIGQQFAVTGSVNQRGQVQPIGGVNEKVEGFYEVCKAKGLTGKQGVLIPSTNVPNLMLKEEVRNAIAEDRFRVYSISHIDQGISILTGVEAGEPGSDGEYPEGTVNRMVSHRLKELAEKARETAGRGKSEDGKSADKATKLAD